MTGLGRFRRQLYLSQRRIGDLQAAERGPLVLAKRRARRRIVRGLFRGLR